VTILLQLLDDETAGREIPARRFPFVVGRAARADLRLTHAGVWERHFSLDAGSSAGIRLLAGEGAITRVNGAPVTETVLRPGDVIEAGGARLRFWLGPVAQKDLRWREWLVWSGLAAWVLAELLLLAALPR
jgi:hypothetical protein